MTSRDLDELQSSVMACEMEVQRMIDFTSRRRCVTPEELGSVALQLRSFQVRIYDISTNLPEPKEESATVKRTIKRRRKKRSYKK